MGKRNSGQDRSLATRQALFRDVNERIFQVASTGGADVGIDFLCECASEECTETLALTRAEYEAVRRSPIRFVIKPGHDDPGVERLVATSTDSLVAEKVGEAARIVRHLDPRSRQQPRPAS
jgi:hypothetical protein